MNQNAIEIFETSDGKAKFYFSHSDENCTTGVLHLEAGAALPKHNRPLAFENLTQLQGKCLMTLFDENDKPTEIELAVGEGIRMHKGQWHIHANPYEEVSLTMFKADGNIQEVMKVIRETSKKLDTNTPKNTTE
jgi:quercetin dioxygenase-like cupin family protein